MARPRRQPTSLSPGQAQYVIERLVRDRKLSAGEISAYVSEMHTEISSLEERLARLRDAAAPVAAAAAGVVAGVAAAIRRRGRRPGRPAAAAAAPAKGRKRGRKARKAITAEQLASRQLQGRYLALVRRFPKARRAQFAKVAKDKGREAAIKEMQDSLKK